jgi:hypothetical protein
MPGKSTIYLVQIQDDKEIKVVRISEGEMETINEIEKL